MGVWQVRKRRKVEENKREKKNIENCNKLNSGYTYVFIWINKSIANLTKKKNLSDETF